MKFFLTMLAALCGLSAARAEEFRGYWVDFANPGMRTQAEITALVNDTKAARMNAILAHVRPRGDAFYVSGYEPRSEYLNTSSPADPLRVLLNAAHAQNPRIEVHAWVNAYKLWSKSTLPASPFHPLRLFPEFINRDDRDNTLTSEGSFFDPGHMRLLDYNVKVVEDLARRYPDLDGIHFDFVRYPTLNWGYSPTALARYSAHTGVVPAKTSDQWTTPMSNWSPGIDPTFSQWRRDQVTGFVREAYARVYRVSPNIKMSAALITIGNAPASATDSAWYTVDPPKYRYQDYFQWMKEGILDEAIAMDYEKAGGATFTPWASFIGAADNGRNSHGIVGQGNYLNTVPDSIVQLKSARAAGSKGHATYSYAAPSINRERTRWTAALTTNNADNANAAPFLTNAATLSTPWKTANGLLTGRVVDSLTGAPPIPATNPVGPSTYASLAGVTVRITAGPTGTVGRAVTVNSMGVYAFVNLPPGAYTVAPVIPSGWPFGASGASGQVIAGRATEVDLQVTPLATAEAFEVENGTGSTSSATGAFYTETGSWLTVSSTDSHGGVSRAASPTSGATAAWTPFVPVAGRYRVYAWWSAGANRSDAATYTAETGTESVAFPAVSQRSEGGRWNLLGTAYFHQGRAGRITLAPSADGYVIADAVRLEREIPEFWPITTYTVPKAILTDAASDGTMAFYGARDGTLYAYHLGEDRPAWRYRPADLPIGAWLTRPSVSDGIIYVGGADGKVRALRSTTTFPEQTVALWTSPALGGAVYGSPSVMDGIVYAGGGDGSVYGLNAASGAIVYRSPFLGARIISTPAVLPEAGVWAELQNGQLVRLSHDLNTVRWASSGGTGTDTSVYTDGRGVFASSGDGNVLAINAANGQPLWKTPVHVGAPARTPMGDGAGTLYLVTADNRLWALDTTTGAPRPGFAGGLPLPGQTGSGAPLVLRHPVGPASVYIPGDGVLTEVTGTVVRQHDLARALGSHGDAVIHSPALAGEFVVATSDNGQLLGWKIR